MNPLSDYLFLLLRLYSVAMPLDSNTAYWFGGSYNQVSRILIIISQDFQVDCGSLDISGRGVFVYIQVTLDVVDDETMDKGKGSIR